MGHYASDMMSDRQAEQRGQWFALLARLEAIKLDHLTVKEFRQVEKWLDRTHGPSFDSSVIDNDRLLDEVRTFCEAHSG